MCCQRKSQLRGRTPEGERAPTLSGRRPLLPAHTDCSRHAATYYDSSSERYATTCDTTSCQVYGGAARRSTASGASTSIEHALTDAATAATANVVRRWPNGHSKSGQIVSTEFSASNGPRTAGGEFPPVDDIGDDTIPNPNHRWTRVIDADTLETKYSSGKSPQRR